MSLRDPDEVRGGRVAFAAVLALLSVLAGGVTGWGFSGVDGATSDVSSTLGQHAIAAFAGLLAMIGLLLAAAFSLPVALRTNALVPVLFALIGVEFLAAAAGLAIGNRHVGPATGVAAVPGAVLVLVAVLQAGKRRSRQRRRSEVDAAGEATVGTITSSSIGGYVNGVPRHRVVVSFADAQGRQRFTTTHVTRWGGVPSGQAVRVHYDPARPSDKRRIFVDL